MFLDTPETLRLRIEDRARLQALRALLRARFQACESGLFTRRRLWLDSFDWRLHRGGYRLIAQSNPGGQWTLLLRDTAGTREQHFTVDRPPEFAGNGAPRALHRFLRARLDMRRLLPVAEQSNRARALQLRNARDKTYARMVLEHARAGGAVAEFQHLRGYDRPAGRLLSLLQQELGLEPEEVDPLEAALHRRGRQPGDYSNKFSLALEAEERSDVGVRRILQRLLDDMQRNEPGTRAHLDPEFLHDFRVAVRRTRSLLGQIKGVLPQRIQTRFAREFAWLGAATGPSRDLDVFLLEFDELMTPLDARSRRTLEPLRAQLREQQQQAHGALTATLDGPRYARLKQSWRDFVESPVSPRSQLSHARTPLKHTADRRIWRSYRKVLKQGRAIDARSPVEDLHRLRKRCKKLRYLMEFFHSLYDHRDMRALIGYLKKLQDHLGALQDTEVQNLTMMQLRSQLPDALDVETDQALDRLLTLLAERKEQIRESFHRRFASFDTPSHARRYKQAFKPQAKSKAT